jgi:hypothetical protein
MKYQKPPPEIMPGLAVDADAALADLSLRYLTYPLPQNPHNYYPQIHKSPRTRNTANPHTRKSITRKPPSAKPQKYYPQKPATPAKVLPANPPPKKRKSITRNVKL